jgi:glycosyltransferase involved in cell wall biosynthesis
MSDHGGAEERGAQWRVTVLTDNFGGGTGRHMVDMLAHRDISDCPTGIICFGIDSGLRPPAGVGFHQRRFRSRLVRFPVPQLRALINLVRRLPPGPNILHTYFFWPIVYGRILKRIGRVTLLIENREDTGFKWGRAHRWLLRNLRPLPDLVICVSPAVRLATLENERLPSHKVVVIENGVSLPGVRQATREKARGRRSIEPQDVLIGMVANLNLSVKAVDRFIDAIPNILAAVPNARFVIAGDGRLRGELELRSRRLGLERHLSFLGHVSDVHELYAAIDISVLTSASEGLSITLLESMAHGLPVVVTAVGGNLDVVDDGETGYLVPFGDSKAFASAVVSLCADTDLRARMGAAGRKKCEAHYDIAGVSARYEAYYKGLVVEHAGGRPTRDRSA